MKKIVILLFVLLAGLTACSTSDQTITIHFAKDQLQIEEVIIDPFLPTQIEGYDIVWSSDPESFLVGSTVRPGPFDQEVILTAKIYDGDIYVSKSFTVLVKGNPDILNDQLDTIQSVINQIEIPLMTETNISLPTEINGVSISWNSSDPDVVSNTGEITRPNEDETDVTVTLRAVFIFEDSSLVKEYDVTIEKLDSSINEDALLIDQVINNLVIPQSTTTNLNFTTSIDSVSITWDSSHVDVISNQGVVQPKQETDTLVTLVVTLQKNQEIKVISYQVLVPKSDTTVGELDPYYQGAESLSGDALKQFLHDLIDDHTMYSYSQLWDLLSETDEDPNNPNNVILLYTGRSQSKTTHGGDKDDWNREHVWAKSHGDFGTATGPGTDLHHIRPTDASVNSSRSNLDFDEGGNIVLDGSIPTLNYKDGDSFEPRDEVKGDVARMIFYMVIRYEGDDGFPDLELNDMVNNSGPYMGKLSILLQWHLEDPPSEFEMNRNDIIEQFQGNRNPFIDVPEFAELIWGN